MPRRKGDGAKLRLAALLAGIVAASVTLGCASHSAGPQRQLKDVDGMVIEVSAHPGLPQDAGSGPVNAGPQTGDNTLVVQLHDDKTNAPVNDANVAASASTSLVGQQRPESGRSQGNGLYLVPIRFGVPDTYVVTVTITRTARPDTSAQFQFTAV